MCEARCPKKAITLVPGAPAAAGAKRVKHEMAAT
jgi:hypothetical protein